MNTNKRNTLVISAVFAAIFSLLFLVIRPVTGIFLISYIFAIVGLALLCASGWYIIDHSKNYPWIAAIPSAVREYLIVELVFSAVFVLVEQIAKWSAGAAGLIEWVQGFHLAPGWYLLIHAVLLLILIIRVILLKGGADHIEKRDADVKAKTQFMAEFRAHIELLVNRTENTELKAKLTALAEAIRYSDPMSANSLSPLERQMAVKSGELKANLADAEKAAALIDELAQLLEERNAKCKILK